MRIWYTGVTGAFEIHWESSFIAPVFLLQKKTVIPGEYLRWLNSWEALWTAFTQSALHALGKDASDFTKIILFDFTSFLQVVSIIEYHARTVDISTHSYYQLLYVFHTYRGNHRKGKNCKIFVSLLFYRGPGRIIPCLSSVIIEEET